MAVVGTAAAGTVRTGQAPGRIQAAAGRQGAGTWPAVEAGTWLAGLVMRRMLASSLENRFLALLVM